MIKHEFFKKKIRCSKCGFWMYPSMITVWGRNFVFKTFRCKKCKHTKDTDSIFRFVFGNSLIEYAEKDNLNIAFDDGSKKTDSSQIRS